MSTRVHADGIKTVVHTSKWATDKQADFLRRSGAGEDTVDYFYKNSAESEAYAHQREHDSIIYCLSIGVLA